MIRIQDERFQKKAMGGTLLLDRASVVDMGIDLREGRGGSPGLRCTVAYGVEEAGETPALPGKFQAFSYDDHQCCLPFYVEPQQFEKRRESAAKAMKKALKGGDLLEAVCLWLEQELVDLGRFGPEATVV